MLIATRTEDLTQDKLRQTSYCLVNGRLVLVRETWDTTACDRLSHDVEVINSDQSLNVDQVRAWLKEGAI